MWSETDHRTQPVLEGSKHLRSEAARNEDSCSPRSFPHFRLKRTTRKPVTKSKGGGGRRGRPHGKVECISPRRWVVMIFHDRDANKTTLSANHFHAHSSGSRLRTVSLPPPPTPPPSCSSLPSYHWSHCLPHLSHFLLLYLNMESGNSH